MLESVNSYQLPGTSDGERRLAGVLPQQTQNRDQPDEGSGRGSDEEYETEGEDDPEASGGEGTSGRKASNSGRGELQAESTPKRSRVSTRLDEEPAHVEHF